ncbi:MAG: class I tRNA ligase family protein, partial [Pseudomonadota bacterium]
MTMDKTFKAAEAEARLSKAWIEGGAFRAGANASRDETFCIMIPPPNVTGSLHMGHAFNNTLQDILTRWHRMRGFDTLWQPGQDHAGIATQMVVERELAETNMRRTDFSREDFVARVWQQKEKSGGTIIEQLKRLGASCDWDRNAFTMAGAPGDTRHGHEASPDFHDAVLKVFVDMYNKGLIYRGKRLVNWDPKFETAISDLEVENIEVDGHMWHFKYPLAGGATYEYVERDADGTVTLREVRDYISIATTRPETMLGDGAVAVHPGDERYAPIVGQLCEIPVGPKETRRLIPIITDEYPDPDFGSGAVKITGAHDFNDYGVAKRNSIPLYRLMDPKGAMRSDGLSYADSAAKAQAIIDGAELSEAEVDQINLVPDAYRGLDRFVARKAIVAAITGEGLAVTHAVTRTDKESGEEITEVVPLVEAKKIMQPFGDRSKVVIEPM